MLRLSDKFQEEFSHVQQQFNEWKPLEQLYAYVELTRTLQVSYRHFLSQSLQNQIQYENNEIFNHTVYEANTPEPVACHRAAAFEKLLITLQLYLPLISIKSCSKELLDAYRDVLIQLDSKLITPNNSSYSDQQLLSYSQQIFFFIQANPNLQNFLSHLPHLTHFVQTKTLRANDHGQYPHKHLQRYPSIRSDQVTPTVPLMNCPSESSHVLPIGQQLRRHEVNDSGVDLTEPGANNFHPLHYQHTFNSQCPSAHLTTASSYRQNPHTSVTETVSSPLPQRVANHVPLAAALSAPMPSLYSDCHRKNTFHRSIQLRPALAKSDEEEQLSEDTAAPDSIPPTNHIKDETNPNQPTKMFRQYYSLRHRPNKQNPSANDVSQYLDVDRNYFTMRNTFIQPNTGMRDVPKWLKQLRLHKYDVVFCQMTYDEMMNLTMDELKQFDITDGACSKILLQIKKLKDRSMVLKQAISDFEHGQIDLAGVVQHLNDLTSTPIRAKQRNQEIDPDDDLPNLIIDALEIANQKVTPTISPIVGNSLLGLFDCCYRHEAFTVEQRHLILQWRGRLSNTLSKAGKIEFKTMQPCFSHPFQSRRTTKPLARNMKSYPTNYSIGSSPLTPYASEPQNNHSFADANPIRRPGKSPTSTYSTNEESHESNMTNFNLSPAFMPMTPTSQRNPEAYLGNNQYPKLSHKPNIHSYGQANPNRQKLCETFSEPRAIRFYSPTQMHSSQFSSMNSTQNNYRMVSTPYSQQQFLSHSPPMINSSSSSSPPIAKSYVDRSDYYDNNAESSAQDQENTDEQRQNNTEFDPFYHQITESAMSDYGATDTAVGSTMNPCSKSSIDIQQ